MNFQYVMQTHGKIFTFFFSLFLQEKNMEKKFQKPFPSCCCRSSPLPGGNHYCLLTILAEEFFAYLSVQMYIKGFVLKHREFSFFKKIIHSQLFENDLQALSKYFCFSWASQFVVLTIPCPHPQLGPFKKLFTSYFHTR